MRRAAWGAAVVVAMAASAPGVAGADEGWRFDETTGDWIATERAGRDASPEGALPDAPRDAGGVAPWAPDPAWAPAPTWTSPSEEPAPRPGRRSSLALAGGIVLTSISGLAALAGGLSFVQGNPDSGALSGSLVVLGAGGIVGGIALISWGAHSEPHRAVVAASPGAVHIGGHF